MLPPPYGPPTPERGFLLDLLDVRFERRVGPALVPWLYLSALVMVAAVIVFGLLMSWWLASWAGWAFWLGVPSHSRRAWSVPSASGWCVSN